MTDSIGNKNSIWNLVFGKKETKKESKVGHLHPKADSIRINLEQIFKDLGGEKEFLSHAEEVIHPLLKEVEYLQSSLKIKECPLVISKYNNWTEKAAKWVKLYSNTSKEEALLHHIVERSHSLIDRDIKLIEKYMEAHKLDPLSKKQLQPELKTLASLRKEPTDLTLKKITAWKSDFNHERAKIVNAALQKIDNLISPQ